MASRLPALGPRGEGWLALQLAGIGLVAWSGAAVPGDPAGVTEWMFVTAGLVIILAGLALAGIAVRTLQIGRALTPMPRPLVTAGLVTSGPYAVIRHPIYAAVLVTCLGWAVAHASTAAVGATLALAVILDLKRRREEAWLVERFPDYLAYRGRTKALIPLVY